MMCWMSGVRLILGIGHADEPGNLMAHTVHILTWYQITDDSCMGPSVYGCTCVFHRQLAPPFCPQHCVATGASESLMASCDIQYCMLVPP